VVCSVLGAALLALFVYKCFIEVEEEEEEDAEDDEELPYDPRSDRELRI
jgi:hypothetical protein